MSKFSEQLSKEVEIPVTELLEQKLDKESLKDFYEALQNKNIAVPVLVKALSELGIEVSVSVIQRWRKNDRVPNTMRRRKAK